MKGFSNYETQILEPRQLFNPTKLERLGRKKKKKKQQNTCLLGKSMAIWGYESLWEETYVFDTDDIHEALLIQHLYRSYLFESDRQP